MLKNRRFTSTKVDDDIQRLETEINEKKEQKMRSEQKLP